MRGEGERNPKVLGMTIIVDSDGLIGLFNKDDAHNATSIFTLEKLIAKEAKLIYPATTLTEATAILQIRLKHPELATKIVDLLIDGKLIIEPVDEILLKEAVTLLKPVGNKHNTLFDAVVATVAKRYKADAIFSFDKWYKKLGFTLVSDIN